MVFVFVFHELGAWRTDTMPLCLWKPEATGWFSKLRAAHSWKLYFWARGQFGMRFTRVWSPAKVPGSHLFSFIAANKKETGEAGASSRAAVRKSAFKVLLKTVLTRRAAPGEHAALGTCRDLAQSQNARVQRGAPESGSPGTPAKEHLGFVFPRKTKAP